MPGLVHRISVPNPFFEGRNSIYLIRSDPVTLIDTGVATEKAYEALRAGITELRVAVSDIRRVILTHKHIDHIGNAWRIQQTSGAEVYIHEVERIALSDIDPTGERFQDLAQKRMTEWNVPVEYQPQKESHKLPEWFLEPVEALGLADGDKLESEAGNITVMHTPGHTLGSICLQFHDMLFTGDHVLEGISPNVGGGDLRHSGLLQHFMQSLERTRLHASAKMAFPGHGQPFHHLSRRCEQLIAHHHDRLNQIVSILDTRSMTVFQIAQKLFGEIDGLHILLGCAEANSHLEMLEELGRVTQLESGAYVAMEAKRG